ncbi:FecR family protein [Dyadobacter crusticola]|uniref:FecR family protein n=1 Tax=Dyadobacter crusticola TaxID=292407 RepID=UPI0004E24B67|nr:FecR family protein [Dyadobacter crusticola]
MNSYKDFEVKDWVEDLQFRRWVYQGESDLFFRSYIQNNPSQLPAMEQAREILLSVRGELDVITETEVKSRVSEILDAIPPAAPQPFFWWKANWLKIAAILVLAFGIGLSLYRRPGALNDLAFTFAKVQPPKKARSMQVTNHTGNIRLVTLPDGSSVILKPNARITYPEQFDKNKREVSMAGEAFFEVVKNPAQPFIVFAGSMVTKVKGTSFSIRANDGDDEVKLVVKSGLVEVSAMENDHEAAGQPRSRKLILKPNEQVTFNQKNNVMTAKLVEKPVLLDLPVEKQDFEFKRTPLAEVFTMMEKTYGIMIRFDADAVSECTITAKLGDEPVSEKMDMICSVVNARYELSNGVITVTSEGCD